MVLVTLLCAWLAWERHVVMKRRAVKRAMDSSEKVILFETATISVVAWGEPVTPATVPWIRRALGDVPIQLIMPLSDSATDAEVVMAARWFPEASVEPLFPGD
jgi:nicotinamide riboside kinase